ncbi:MAG TPA: aspartate-semialdehyde dehydrogenase [Bacteroidetes bacterium]|nr:aspartate-semialdehyde dehydrogenase [Bacteroidota bacterium]
MKIALVGATGLVGREMLKVLSEENFPVSELILVASARSLGQKIHFQNTEWTVVSMDEAISRKPDIALFSAGGSVSREHAPRFAEVGTIVIDNSSAWRMDPNVPLVVPEINADAIGNAKIIANPNCSTIQMVMALAPLQKNYGICRLVISTYQSVSGTGKVAVQQLMDERAGIEGKKAYSNVIDMNCIPHCDVFLDNAYTREEMKLVHETRKILGVPDLPITATAVRVPVIGGHSESVNVELNQPFELAEVRSQIGAMPGITIQDDPSQSIYPNPRQAHGHNDVFVGRLRRDHSHPQALNMWIVADNLRKGAATNAVQIALHLIRAKQTLTSGNA